MSDDSVQQKVTKTFRNNVLQWVEIDDNIKILRNKIKELSNDKKTFEESILTYLVQVEEDSVVIKDGKLSKNVTKAKAPLKKDTIQKALVELIGDANKATTMTEHIINSRPTVERVNLKRCRNKKTEES
jgi:hypothetical protein